MKYNCIKFYFYLGGRQNRRIPPDERDQDDESSDGMRDPLHVEPMGKIGAKKRAKLEAKAERKMQREVSGIVDFNFNVANHDDYTSSLIRCWLYPVLTLNDYLY